MKRFAFFLAVCLCCLLAACENATGNGSIPQQTTQAEQVVTESITVPAETVIPETTAVPTTQPPRVTGPDRIEGNAVVIENVTVEYAQELPRSIQTSSTYRATDSRDDFVLDESQVYAVVRFRLTSKTTKEIEIADIHDDFLVELIYDNRYVYSPDNGSRCVFQSGSQIAAVADMSSIGAVTLAPLSSKDVTVYIPCAREVSTQLEKYLIVVFTSNYSGYENFEFTIR